MNKLYKSLLKKVANDASVSEEPKVFYNFDLNKISDKLDEVYEIEIDDSGSDAAYIIYDEIKSEISENTYGTTSEGFSNTIVYNRASEFSKKDLDLAIECILHYNLNHNENFENVDEVGDYSESKYIDKKLVDFAAQYSDQAIQKLNQENIQTYPDLSDPYSVENGTFSKDKKEKALNALKIFTANNVINGTPLSNLLDLAYQNHFFNYIPIDHRFDSYKIKEKQSSDDQNFQFLTEDEINDSENFDHLMSKYILEKIYSIDDAPEIVFDYDEADLDSDAESYLKKEDFDAANFQDQTSSDIYTKAYKDFSEILIRYINNYESSLFYGTDYSSEDLDYKPNNPAYEIVRFRKQGDNRNDLNAFINGELASSLNISFPSINNCVLKYTYNSVNLTIVCDLELESLNIISGAEQQGKSFLSLPNWKPQSYNTDPLFSFIKEKRNYLAFKYLAENSYDNEILFAAISRSGHSYREGLSGSSAETSSGQLDILLEKIFESQEESQSSAPGLDDAINRANPLRGLGRPFSSKESEYPEYEFSQESSYSKSIVGLSPENIISTDKLGAKEKAEFEKEILNPEYNLTQIANREALLIEPKPIEGVSNDLLVQNAQLNQVFSRMFEQDISKIYDLKAKIPNKFSKIIGNAISNINDPDKGYGKSRSDTKDSKYEIGWLNFGDPAQNQVIATYIENFVSSSWPIISSDIKKSFSDIGIEMSDREMSQILESYQTEAINSLRNTNTSRSISSTEDLYSLVNFDFSEQSITNDFKSFMIKYQSEESSPNENESQADDFEVKKSFLRDLSLKSYSKIPNKFRKHFVNSLYKFSSGNTVANNQIDIVSDINSAQIRSEIYSDVSFYQEIREGQYFLPISIKGDAQVNISEIRFFHESSRGNAIASTRVKRRFADSEYISGKKTLPFSTIFYSNKDSVVMSNDLLKLEDSGKNLFATDGLLQALGVNEEGLAEIINTFKEEKKKSAISNIKITFGIECFGESESFSLTLKKEGGSWITLIEGPERCFVNVLRNIEERVLELYTSETNGMMHRYLEDGGQYPTRSKSGVSREQFKRWFMQGPNDTVEPIEVYFDSEGRATRLSTGAPVQVSTEENPFAAKYSKDRGSIESISGQIEDPRTTKFFGRPDLGSLEQINLNGSNLTQLERSVPSIFDIDLRKAEDRAIINTFDPINKIAIERANSMATDAPTLNSKYSFVRMETQTNKKISALMDVLECLSYIKENQILKDLSLTGEISDAKKKLYFESVRQNSAVIITELLEERRKLLTIPEGVNSVALTADQQKSLICIDKCLLEIKDLCESDGNRLFRSLSRTLQTSAPWLRAGSNLVFSSDQTLSLNRSNFSAESMRAAKTSVSQESLDLAQRCSSNIYSASNKLLDSGTTYSKDIDKLSKVFYSFMSSEGLKIDELTFDQKINFMTSILSNTYSGKADLAPDSYNVNNPHKLLHEILTNNDDFSKVLTPVEIEAVRSISEANKTKMILGSNINIKKEEDLIKFLSSEEGKPLSDFLESSKLKFNERLIDISKAIESKNIGDYNKAVSELNKEISTIKSFSQPGGAYISSFLIDNIILGQIESIPSVSEKLPSFIETMSKIKPYGKGFALNFLSDISANQDEFYKYVLSDQSLVVEIKTSLMDQLQKSSKVTIQSRVGSDLEFSLDAGDGASRNNFELVDDLRASQLGMDAFDVDLDNLKELYLNQESDNLSRGVKTKRMLDSINVAGAGDKDSILRAYYCLDTGDFAKIVMGSDIMRSPSYSGYSIQAKFTPTSPNPSSIEITYINEFTLGGKPKVIDALKISKQKEQALTKKMFSGSANNFQNPRDKESFVKLILDDIKTNQSLRTRINFGGYDFNGQPKYSFSIYYDNKPVLTTKYETIGQIYADYNSSDPKYKILKEALLNAGFAKEDLSDMQGMKKCLSELNRDAEAVSRLRAADLSRGVRTFDVLYSDRVSKNLLEAMDEIKGLSVSKKAFEYNRTIKLYVDESTRKMTPSVSGSDSSKVEATKIYKELKSAREYYNANRYSNPDLANKILEDIKSKFPEDSAEDINKFLYYMGFDTMARPIESGASGVARASMTIQELRILESHLNLIEEIRLQNTMFGNYKSFEKRIADEVIPTPKEFDSLRGGSLVIVGRGSDSFERSKSLVEFLLEEIEYIEGTGNFELASRMRSGLYEALDVGASKYILRTADSLYKTNIEFRWVTKGTNDLGWFLSKIGIFEESDLKKASDILNEAKDLEKLLAKANRQLSEKASELKATLDSEAGNISDEIDKLTSQIESLEEEIRKIQYAIESGSISNIDLETSKAKLEEVNKAKAGLSKTKKVLKFGLNMILGSASPLNSMEFLYLSMAWSVGAGLAGNIGEALGGLGISLFTNIKGFVKSVSSNFKNYVSIYIKRSGKASRLREIIPTYRVGASEEIGEGTNKLIQTVEDYTYSSYSSGAINNNDLRKTQEAIAFGYAKPKGKVSKGKVLSTLKASLGCLGKLFAHLGMVVYAKTLYDNISGDQAEMGVLFPSEVVHNLSLAFIKMEDHAFKSSSCREGNCEKNLFLEQDIVKLSVGESQKRSLYYAILDSESYTELNSGIEKIVASKESIKKIIDSALKREGNIDQNLDDSAKLSGAYASHAETFTTISTVLPRVLADGITNFIGIDSDSLINWIIHAILKATGLFLATLNAVDIVSLFANKILASGDKLKPTQIAMEGSLGYIDSVIDDIINTIKSLNVFQVTYKNHIASESGSEKDFFLEDFYSYYNEKLKQQ